jgi:SEC-C motif
MTEHRADWTEGDVTALLANPIYAIHLHPDLCKRYAPLQTEEQWVEKNLALMEELGREEWVRTLLAVLKGEEGRRDQLPSAADMTPEAGALIQINPVTAINIPETYALASPMGVSEDQWAQVALSLIEDMGAEPYLHNLLAVLKGANPAGSDVPFGYTVASEPRPGRNDACLCGSGRKYKHCCGR